MAHHFVTIKDIAKTLKISVSTVSRALRDTYDVNKETREKVVALAAELKYKPNFNATGLAKRSTHNIGVILPYITNDYFSKVITGVQEIAYGKEFNITLFLTNDSPERELAITQNLPISSLDGLLVSVSSNSNSYDHFRDLMDNDLPIVFFDRVASDIKTSKVMQDDYNGAFEAVEHLIKNGYRRIAHISAPIELTITKKRLQGYIEALQKHNIPVREEWIIYSGFSQESGEKDTYELLKCKVKPDAIFALNDRKAVGAMIALKNKKINIGKEIGVIGFANDPIASVITPTLSTISVPAFDIGKISCDLLFKHIKNRSFSFQEITLPCELIVRESTIKK
jgi:LacI family transcriptional regulator, galactose operon repressor